MRPHISRHDDYSSQNCSRLEVVSLVIKMHDYKSIRSSKMGTEMELQLHVSVSLLTLKCNSTVLIT